MGKQCTCALYVVCFLLMTSGRQERGDKWSEGFGKGPTRTQVRHHAAPLRVDLVLFRDGFAEHGTGPGDHRDRGVITRGLYTKN